MPANHLKRLTVKSCGCLRDEKTVARATKHGASHNPDMREYTAWMGMRQRCTNPNNQKFADYGGRGIRVCDRWGEFAVFFADMGRKPSPSHSLDRIDVDGDYEPSNCRWATPTEQANNRRSRRRWAVWTPERRFNQGIQKSMRDCLVGRKKAGKRWQQIVGYSIEDLRRHIERQFGKGMSWNNARDWDLEHITPLSHFGYPAAGTSEFKQCWAITNLRPCWHRANLAKKARRTHLL